MSDNNIDFFDFSVCRNCHGRGHYSIKGKATTASRARPLQHQGQGHYSIKGKDGRNKQCAWCNCFGKLCRGQKMTKGDADEIRRIKNGKNVSEVSQAE